MPEQLNIIIKKIDSVLHNQPYANTSWSTMLATAIINKDKVKLSDILSCGAGFNDNSKRAFCEVLGVDVKLTKNGIDAYIATHCGITNEQLILEREISNALHRKDEASEHLITTFLNGDELVAWVDDLIERGFNVITSSNRKYFLTKEDRGFDLLKPEIRKYAESSISVINFKNKLNTLSD